MLDKLHFVAMVDLPLALATVLALILHFNSWARANDADISVDLAARLAAARIRVVCLFAVIVGLCWIADFAVWAVFAFLLGIGVAIALLAGGQAAGGEFLLGWAGYLIREWAFGFPQLVLHPPEKSRMTRHGTPAGDDSPLIGKSGLVAAPLRPCGQIECEGAVWPARAEDGRYVDAGTTIVVTGLQSGVFLVRITNTEQWSAQMAENPAVNRSGPSHASGNQHL
jgi:hypothetical protein